LGTSRGMELFKGAIGLDVASTTKPRGGYSLRQRDGRSPNLEGNEKK